VGARSDIFGHATVFNLYRFGADGPRRIREAERDLNAPVVAAQD